MDASGEFCGLILAGTAGALALAALTTPLDVARHSAQAAATPRRPLPLLAGALRAAIPPEAGAWRGLWRGLAPALGRAALAPATFLLVYEVQKGHRGAAEAAVVAKAVQTAALQPFDFWRTCKQAGALLTPKQRAHLERGLWEKISSDELKSFWRGGMCTVLRDGAFAVAFWSSYCTLQLALNPGADPKDWGHGAGASAPLLAAALASVCATAAAAVTQPLDFVKTRMQVHQLVRSSEDGYRKVKVPRFFATAREAYAVAGVRGLWTGGLARALCAAAGGLVLGPLLEFAQVIAGDAGRPLRRPLVLPEDPRRTIVHPRSTRSMFIEVK